ncbi:methyltransferase family protein [Halobacillus naozhouensis]|uniref:DUF1295 domain-containing protein n=1 Tax=Halobacillus naozhouensis TaxID=554880 RepID=A0ABY8J4J0_9BACI|nr:DUF1295 domain-containing protein [Halobacillus naozhouensis]WFT76359.1 DUF1295 domain-containing protein [Halobacillus naozhouensis]
MYQGKERSTSQKITVVLLESVILIIAGWFLFLEGGQQLSNWFGWSFTEGNEIRNTTLFILFLIVYGRMGITLFYLLKRKMPWAEAFSVPLAFSLYYIGFSLFSLTTHKPLTTLDFVYILLFLFGSFINTYSELQRHEWKKNPEHKGELYTEGLFNYAMHINYFGDLVWVTALALLTRSPWAMSIPIILFCFFAFYNIPLLDKYLAEKYGSQFDTYRKHTKKFIPFIY